jgi:hypothetical protein
VCQDHADAAGLLKQVMDLRQAIAATSASEKAAKTVCPLRTPSTPSHTSFARTLPTPQSSLPGHKLFSFFSVSYVHLYVYVPRV